MRKIAILLVIVFLFSGCSNRGNFQKISSSDKNELMQIATNYYNSVEHNNILNALSYVDFSDKSENIEYEYNHRQIAFNEILKTTAYTVELEQFVSNGLDENGETIYVVYESSINKYTVSSQLKIEFKDNFKSLIGEKLAFDKVNGNWKIIEIQSSDRYVPFRANEFSYSTIPDL